MHRQKHPKAFPELLNLEGHHDGRPLSTGTSPNLTLHTEVDVKMSNTLASAVSSPLFEYILKIQYTLEHKIGMAQVISQIVC